MLSWFRKYNRILLVVLGSVLMVVFLLPVGTGLFNPDPMAEPIGVVGGEEVTRGDTARAASEIELLERITGQRLPFEPLQWVLLTQEAQRHGIFVPQAVGMASVEQMMTDNPQMRSVLQSTGASTELLASAFQHMQMIQELTQMMFGDRYSEPRLRHFARDIRSQATVEVVPVDASNLLDSATEPTPEQIQQQYEKYRDDAPGTTEPYGFGYRLPPRVKLEYIAVPLERVTQSVQVGEVEAQRYYYEHPERFMAPPPQPVPGPDGKMQAPPPTPKGPQPYIEVRERVKDELRQQLAAEKQNRIVQDIIATFSENIRRLKLDEQGYRVVTDDFKPMPMEELAQQIQQAHGVLPDVKRFEDGYLTATEINALPGFGEAIVELGQQAAPVAAYVQSTRELGLETGLLETLKLQESVASRPVIDLNGNVYVFRVTDAQQAREPRSVDEVRAQVVRDLKRVQAYEQLKERAERLADRAAQEGLEKVAADFNAKVERVGPFSAYDFMAALQSRRLELPNLPVVGRSEKFVESVFELAERVRQAGGLQQANAQQKIAAIPIDAQQRVLLTRLAAYQPIDSASFERDKVGILPFLMGQQTQQDLAESPFELDALIRRTGFQYTDGREEEEEAAEEEAEGVKAAAAVE